jgi:hypothetical protein
MAREKSIIPNITVNRTVITTANSTSVLPRSVALDFEFCGLLIKTGLD